MKKIQQLSRAGPGHTGAPPRWQLIKTTELTGSESSEGCRPSNHCVHRADLQNLNSSVSFKHRDHQHPDIKTDLSG